MPIFPTKVKYLNPTNLSHKIIDDNLTIIAVLQQLDTNIFLRNYFIYNYKNIIIIIKYFIYSILNIINIIKNNFFKNKIIFLHYYNIIHYFLIIKYVNIMKILHLLKRERDFSNGIYLSRKQTEYKFKKLLQLETESRYCALIE